MSQQNTQIYFDGQRINISSDLMPIFYFLKEIENEIESVINIGNKLEHIKNGYRDALDLILVMADKLKEANIDYEMHLQNHPNSIVSEFEFIVPTRVQFIALFASLEVLLFLHLAYMKETVDEKELKKFAQNSASGFYDTFLLSAENKYFKNNQEVFKEISGVKLRTLRNKLTHFYSLGGDGLSLARSRQEAIELEANIPTSVKELHNIIFITTTELFQLIRAAHLLKIKQWSDDCISDGITFKHKITFVRELVGTEGAIILKKNDPSI